MNVKEKIQEVSLLLDELDDYKTELSSLISEDDGKVSDLYHFLELMSLDSKKCYRFCKELKNVLVERRKHKRDKAFLDSLDQQKHKLINGKDNRKMLMNSIYKLDKYKVTLDKSNYYTEEELQEKIGE